MSRPVVGEAGPVLQPTAIEAEGSGVGKLVVKRWRRYGKDRLYVNTDDGRRVGWVDLVDEACRRRRLPSQALYRRGSDTGIGRVMCGREVAPLGRWWRWRCRRSW